MKKYEVTVTRSSGQTRTILVAAENEEEAKEEAADLADDGDWEYFDDEEIEAVEMNDDGNAKT